MRLVLRVAVIVAVLAVLAGGVYGLASGRSEKAVQSAVATPSKARPPKFACEVKDAAKKGWVLPVYVHQPGKGGYKAAASVIRWTVWETDQAVDASARRFGTSRRIRFVQDAGCKPLVADLSFKAGRDRSELNAAFRATSAAQPASVRKLLKAHRVKLLFFVGDDAITTSCTGGGSDAGLSDGGVILPHWCWSEAGLTHEFAHSFGLSHCDQDGKGPNGNDPLCRGWGTRPECVKDPASTYLLDFCRTDAFRYFEPKPLPGKKKLARHRNVAFSPYFIQGRPSAPVNFRMRVAGSRKCLDGGRAAVILMPCRAVANQTWQRSIDRTGHLKLRNTGTGRCLRMKTTPQALAAAVTSVRCGAGDATQQWVPDRASDGTNFVVRAGGMKGARLAVQNGEIRDGSPIVRGGGTRLVMDTAVTRGSRKAPVLGRVSLRSRAHGTCLAAKGTRIVLGSCKTRWERIPTVRLGTGLRLNGRCLALGPVRDGRRLVVLAPCSGTDRGQLWLFDTGDDGYASIRSANLKTVRGTASQSDQVVVYSGNPANNIPVHSGVPYGDSEAKFAIG